MKKIKAIDIIPLRGHHQDMETQLVKMSAWVQTLGYVLEGMDTEGAKATESEDKAVAFASHFTAYSEMLFLALDGLQSCYSAIEKLTDQEWELLDTGE